MYTIKVAGCQSTDPDFCAITCLFMSVDRVNECFFIYYYYLLLLLLLLIFLPLNQLKTGK